MKALLLILCLTTLLGFKPQNFEKEEFNVFEYEMRLDKGESSLVYYYNQKCYTTYIKLRRSGLVYIIDSETFIYKFNIIKIKSANQYGNVFLAARTGDAQLYSIIETYTDDKFFLTIKPIRFNSKYSIDDQGLVISKEHVCGMY